ncbi:hypothetical protein ACQP3J_31830, partial [Escherichia coli]
TKCFHCLKKMCLGYLYIFLTAFPDVKKFTFVWQSLILSLLLLPHTFPLMDGIQGIKHAKQAVHLRPEPHLQPF